MADNSKSDKLKYEHCGESIVGSGDKQNKRLMIGHLQEAQSAMAFTHRENIDCEEGATKSTEGSLEQTGIEKTFVSIRHNSEDNTKMQIMESKWKCEKNSSDHDFSHVSRSNILTSGRSDTNPLQLFERASETNCRITDDTTVCSSAATVTIIAKPEQLHLRYNQDGLVTHNLSKGSNHLPPFSQRNPLVSCTDTVNYGQEVGNETPIMRAELKDTRGEYMYLDNQYEHYESKENNTTAYCQGIENVETIPINIKKNNEVSLGSRPKTNTKTQCRNINYKMTITGFGNMGNYCDVQKGHVNVSRARGIKIKHQDTSRSTIAEESENLPDSRTCRYVITVRQFIPVTYLPNHTETSVRNEDSSEPPENEKRTGMCQQRDATVVQRRRQCENVAELRIVLLQESHDDESSNQRRQCVTLVARLTQSDVNTRLPAGHFPVSVLQDGLQFSLNSAEDTNADSNRRTIQELRLINLPYNRAGMCQLNDTTLVQRGRQCENVATLHIPLQESHVDQSSNQRTQCVTSITRLTHSDVNTRLPGGHLPVSVLQDGLQFSPNSAEDTNAYNSRRTIPELPAIGYPYHRGGDRILTDPALPATVQEQPENEMRTGMCQLNDTTLVQRGRQCENVATLHIPLQESHVDQSSNQRTQCVTLVARLTQSDVNTRLPAGHFPVSVLQDGLQFSLNSAEDTNADSNRRTIQELRLINLPYNRAGMCQLNDTTLVQRGRQCENVATLHIPLQESHVDQSSNQRTQCVTSITRLTHSDVNTRLPGGHLPVSVLQDGLQLSPNSAEDTNAYNSRRTIPELPAIGYPYHRGGDRILTDPALPATVQEQPENEMRIGMCQLNDTTLVQRGRQCENVATLHIPLQESHVDQSSNHRTQCVTSITRLTHSDVNTRLPGGHLPVSVLQDGLQFSPNSAEDTNAYNSRRTIPELPAIGYPYHRGDDNGGGDDDDGGGDDILRRTYGVHIITVNVRPKTQFSGIDSARNNGFLFTISKAEYVKRFFSIAGFRYSHRNSDTFYFVDDDRNQTGIIGELNNIKYRFKNLCFACFSGTLVNGKEITYQEDLVITLGLFKDGRRCGAAMVA